MVWWWPSVPTTQAEEEAVDRSIQLLRSWLSPEQREQFEHDQTFIAVGNHTGARYRIEKGAVYNIYRLDEEGKPAETLCCVPGTPGGGSALYQPSLPVGDVMLAQKMTIEKDEETLLKVANIRTGCYWGPQL